MGSRVVDQESGSMSVDTAWCAQARVAARSARAGAVISGRKETPASVRKAMHFNNRLKLEALEDDEWDYIQNLIADLNISSI